MQRKFKYILYSIIIVFLIPIVLNFVLQWNTNPTGTTPIITSPGENDGPKIWLAFWATYIGAIGATVIAAMSYYQTTKSEGQRTKERYYDNLRYEADRKYREYSDLDSYILKQMDVYMADNILVLYDLTISMKEEHIKEDTFRKFYEKSNQIYREFQKTQMSFIKYFEINSHEAHELMATIRNLNESALEFHENITKCIYSNSEKPLSQEDFALLFIEYKTHYEKFADAAFDMLNYKHSKLIEINKELKNSL